MNVSKVISAGVIGTSIMTLFSYWLSEEKNKHFREPELLAILLKRLLKTKDEKAMQLAGWILHYMVGILFTAGYDQLWQKKKMKPSVVNGVVLGALSGVVGKEVWNLVLNLHPKPPAIDRKAYFAHLVVAHVIFGAFATLGYKVTKEDGNVLLR